MSNNAEIKVTMTSTELGLMMAVNAMAIALKASAGFNHEALALIAQKFIDEAPSVIQDGSAREAYERPLRALVNDQKQAVSWVEKNISGN